MWVGRPQVSNFLNSDDLLQRRQKMKQKKIFKGIDVDSSWPTYVGKSVD
jgi:hypothetical protein